MDSWTQAEIYNVQINIRQTKITQYKYTHTHVSHIQAAVFLLNWTKL